MKALILRLHRLILGVDIFVQVIRTSNKKFEGLATTSTQLTSQKRLVPDADLLGRVTEMNI
jgi:hypothetical protein